MPLSSHTLPQGAKAPFNLPFTFTPKIPKPPALPYDLTNVISVTWKVTRPDNTTVIWIPVISQQTSSSFLGTYTFAADGSDLQQLGSYSVEVDAAIAAGGSIPGTAFSFQVVLARLWTPS